jgi:hypothetical protein
VLEVSLQQLVRIRHVEQQEKDNDRHGNLHFAVTHCDMREDRSYASVVFELR